MLQLDQFATRLIVILLQLALVITGVFEVLKKNNIFLRIVIDILPGIVYYCIRYGFFTQVKYYFQWN